MQISAQRTITECWPVYFYIFTTNFFSHCMTPVNMFMRKISEADKIQLDLSQMSKAMAENLIEVHGA